MSETKQAEPVSTTPEAEYTEEQKKNYELQKENAARRVENKELKSRLEELEQVAKKFEEAERAKLEEQGKFKELLDKSEAERLALAEKAKKVDEYEGLLSKQLDDNLKGLSDDNVEFIGKLQMPLVQKIEMAQRLKGITAPPSESPASDRPGGVTESAAKVFNQIDSEKDIWKRAQMIQDLKKQSPDLWKKYLNAGG